MTTKAADQGGPQPTAQRKHRKRGPIKGAASRYRPGLVIFPSINTLEQVRKPTSRHPYDEHAWTYEGIVPLADDLAQRWFINPVQVAVCNRKQAEAYLAKVNAVWQVQYKLSDLRGVREGRRCWYWILISGHRRLEALKLLWEHGCTDCRKLYGAERPGKCYRRHSPQRGRELRVHRYFNIDPTTALAIQLSENMHNRVPPHENADALFRLFASEKLDDPALTVGGFARRCEISADTVNRAVRFCLLPSDIQADTRKGLLKFGVALELGRLREEVIVPVKEQITELETSGVDPLLLDCLRATDAENCFKMERWHQNAVSERWGVALARHKVDEALRDLRAGRISLYGDELATVDRAHEKAARKAAFERRLLDGIHRFMRAWRGFEEAVAANEADASTALYADPALRKLFRQTVELAAAHLPGLRLYLSAEEADVAAAVLGETSKICGELDLLAGFKD